MVESVSGYILFKCLYFLREYKASVSGDELVVGYFRQDWGKIRRRTISNILSKSNSSLNICFVLQCLVLCGTRRVSHERTE